MPGIFGTMNHRMTVSSSTPMAGAGSVVRTAEQYREAYRQAQDDRARQKFIARAGGERAWNAMQDYAGRTWSDEKMQAWQAIGQHGSEADQARAFNQLKREFFDSELRREPTGKFGG